MTPLREAELQSVVGRLLCAVVFDGDISINTSPLNGSLKGANLGTAAFQVLALVPSTCGSSTPSVPPELKGAGSTCTNNAGCFSQQCLNSVCATGPQGSACAVTSDCGTNLVCTQQVCSVPPIN